MKKKTMLSCLVVIAALLATLNCSSSGTATKTSADGGSPVSPRTIGNKPSGTPRPQPPDKIAPAPSDWDTVYNDEYGYEFKLPANYSETTRPGQVSNGNVFVEHPSRDEPTLPTVILLATKDDISRDELISRGEKMLRGAGNESTVSIGTVENRGNDYGLAPFSFINKNNQKIMGKVLISTDKARNFMMFVGSREGSASANEKTMEEIWGSFTAYSGTTGKN